MIVYLLSTIFSLHLSLHQVSPVSHLGEPGVCLIRNFPNNSDVLKHIVREDRAPTVRDLLFCIPFQLCPCGPGSLTGSHVNKHWSWWERGLDPLFLGDCQCRWRLNDLFMFAYWNRLHLLLEAMSSHHPILRCLLQDREVLSELLLWFVV